MAREDPKFMLRMSADLKKRIDVASKGNNRSMNAEIVLRLEESFRRMPRAELEAIVNETQATLARLEASIEADRAIGPLKKG